MVFRKGTTSPKLIAANSKVIAASIAWQPNTLYILNKNNT